jgi:hypothetical protein
MIARVVRIALCVGALSAMPVVTGCGGGGMVTAAIVNTTPDVVVKGDDFSLSPNKEAQIPFVLPVWESGSQGDDDMPSAYRKWLTKGAQRVMVYTKGREQPYYGVISFHKIPSESTGPATRSFSLQVGANYLADATDGKVSVVFEIVPQRGGGKAYGWVLWLSDRPL